MAALFYKRKILFLVIGFIVLAETVISLNSTLMPAIKNEFAISNQLAQITMAAGLLSLGIAGLIYGGLSDALGRRPIFLFSIFLFTIMSLICALAPNAQIFLLARFLQGLGAGAGWVIGNCCLNDLYTGKEYSRVMNYVHAIAGITPAAVPIIGAYFGVIIGWRACFGVLFIFSTILAFSMCIFQKETIKTYQKFNIRQFIADYRTLIFNQNFIIYGIVKVLAVMMIFCEIANVPLIFINYMHVPEKYYGLYVFPLFSCYILATLLSSYLLYRDWSIDNLLKFGLSLVFLSNFLIFLLETIGVNLTAIMIQLIKTMSYAGWGFIFGNATAVIVSSLPGKSGAASALMIGLEMLFSFSGIYFLGFFFNGTIIPLSAFLSFVSLVAIVSLLFSSKAITYKTTITALNNP